VLLTKCYAGLPEDTENLDDAELLKRTSVNDGVMVNRVGLSRKHIFDAVDASIARLGTYIDVLQIHRLDRETPREEIMKALNDVVESGKARYIGACSVGYLLKLRAHLNHLHEIEISMVTDRRSDGRVGVSDPSEHCQTKWLAPVHQHARLL
jgi:aryl-alcohol dehydrogenase-like predicted oxidoreductase